MMNGPGPTHVSNTSIGGARPPGGEAYVKRHPVRSPSTSRGARRRLVTEQGRTAGARDFYPAATGRRDDDGEVHPGRLDLLRVALRRLVHDAVAAGGQMIAVQTTTPLGKTEGARSSWPWCGSGPPSTACPRDGVDDRHLRCRPAKWLRSATQRAVRAGHRCSDPLAAPGQQIATVAAGWASGRRSSSMWPPRFSGQLLAERASGWAPVWRRPRAPRDARPPAGEPTAAASSPALWPGPGRHPTYNRPRTSGDHTGCGRRSEAVGADRRRCQPDGTGASPTSWRRPTMRSTWLHRAGKPGSARRT